MRGGEKKSSCLGESRLKYFFFEDAGENTNLTFKGFFSNATELYPNAIPRLEKCSRFVGDFGAEKLIQLVQRSTLTFQITSKVFKICFSRWLIIAKLLNAVV